jgi:hypothetical protein
MKAKIRRKIEMAARALQFSRAHDDASPGYAAAVARLEEGLARAGRAAAQQRDGILECRAATAQKHALRRLMRRTQLMHLVRVARVAAKEEPELKQTFLLAREASPYMTFRTAARAIVAEAQTRKEFLVRYGLADTVFDSLVPTLDQFDRAIGQEIEGRRLHVGASAELESLARELVQMVQVIDALNRFRFARDTESLAAWESSITSFARERSGAAKEGQTAAGDIKPAA